MKTTTRMFKAGLLSLLLVITHPSTAGIIGFNSLNIFGDSLSDIGNDHNFTSGLAPPASRYSDGRFSDGKVWVEFLASTLGHNLVASTDHFDLAAGDSVSFAYGGAGTGFSNMTPGGFPVPGLLGQVDEYKAALTRQGQTADPRALNIVYAGSNDYLLGLTAPGLGLKADPNEVINNISASIMELHALGGRHFLVPNLVDLGSTPLSLMLGIETPASDLSQIHNNQLALALQNLATSLIDVNLYNLDIHRLSEAIFDDPAAFGFTSGPSGPLVAGPASGCLFPPNVCTPLIDFNSTAVYWDELHPSSLFHEALAKEALSALPSSIPTPDSLLLVLFGLLIQTLIRIKR